MMYSQEQYENLLQAEVLYLLANGWSRLIEKSEDGQILWLKKDFYIDDNEYTQEDALLIQKQFDKDNGCYFSGF